MRRSGRIKKLPERSNSVKDPDLSNTPTESRSEDDDFDDDNQKSHVFQSDTLTEDEDSNSSPPKKRRKQTRETSKLSLHVSTDREATKESNELWRPGVRTGLGPGRQVAIPKAKARSAGKVPYSDDRIHPNTMAFLGDLALNNDREWLKSEPDLDLPQ